MSNSAVLEKIGSQIKSARERSDLSLEELASETKVASRHIYNIEQGNRDQLPEETYLLGYLSKLLKTLRFKNINSVLERLKQQEADMVLEEIINDNVLDDKPKSFEFTQYHFYALLIVFLLGLTWLVFDVSKVNTAKQATKPVVQLVVEEPVQELLSSDLPDFVKGQGSKQLDVEVIDNAWYQVLGVNQEEILFEGDVYYDHGYKVFRFFDDTGFVFSTGNAGAFKVRADEQDFVLGEPGQTIQWFYPASIQQFYIQKNSPVIKEPEKSRKLFGRFRRKKN